MGGQERLGTAGCFNGVKQIGTTGFNLHTPDRKIIGAFKLIVHHDEFIWAVEENQMGLVHTCFLVVHHLWP
jgi:hypothetical protein